MNIKRAKEEIEHTVKAYLAKDALGEYAIPAIRLVVPTPALEQAAREAAEEAKAAGLDLIDLDELPQL